MASIGKFIFFFLFLVSFSSIQIQARESKHFSKFMHYGTKESISDTPVGEPVSAPAPAPVESNENGYGLYGHETGLFPPSKETPTTTTTTTTSTVTTTANEVDENELLNQELDAYTYEKGYQGSNNNNGYTTSNYNNNNNNNNNNYDKNTYRLASASYVTGNQNNNGYTTYTNNKNNNNGYYTNNYNNDNNGYQANNYNNNGYETERQGMSDTRFVEGGQTNNYNNNGYETERQGMSDTRFMENGKFYYDVNNENNHYQPTGYESETNTKYPNEFNTMEEYENQGEYQESQNKSELP